METREQSRSSSKRHYEKNREYYRERNRKARQQKVDYLQELRTDQPCADCGEVFPYYVMEFDHARGEKVANVTSLPSHSWKKLHAELAKCDIVCANCHRVRTHRRRHA